MGHCVGCDKETDWCCADCMIDTREKVYVCESPDCRAKHEAAGCTKPREKYPEGPGTIPPKVVHGPLPEKLPDLIPKKWPATGETLTLAQRFNAILKAYGVLFSDDAMRSRLIIDLMSEVTGGTLTVTE